MFDALQNGIVDIVLLDTFNLGGKAMQDTLAAKKLKIAEQIDTQSGYGVVLGGVARTMIHDIKSALLQKENIITNFIEKFKKDLPVIFINRLC